MEAYCYYLLYFLATRLNYHRRSFYFVVFKKTNQSLHIIIITWYNKDSLRSKMTVSCVTSFYGFFSSSFVRSPGLLNGIVDRRNRTPAKPRIDAARRKIQPRRLTSARRSRFPLSIARDLTFFFHFLAR